MYMLNHEYGAAQFDHIDDVLNALSQLAALKGIKVDQKEARRTLEVVGYYEVYPFSVVQAD